MIGPGSTPRRISRRVLSMMGFGELIADLRAVRAERLRRQRRDEWQRLLGGGSSYIHPTFEITGAGEPPGDWLQVGENSSIERDVTVWRDPAQGSHGILCLGDRTFVGRNTYFGVHDSIRVGQNTMIGAYGYITSGNHAFEKRDLPMRDQGFSYKPVDIASDVWLGTHVIILPGVSIGQGAIIGAGAVVTRNVPPYEIWGGVPARRLGQRE